MSFFVKKQSPLPGGTASSELQLFYFAFVFSTREGRKALYPGMRKLQHPPAASSHKAQSEHKMSDISLNQLKFFIR
jgi:hypothetical protein